MEKKDIFDELENDLNITEENLKEKLYKIPMIHCKWQKVFFNQKKKLIGKTKELSILYRKKYYEYKEGENLLNLKEIDFHIISDPEYSELRSEVQKLELLVSTLESSIKKISQMTFDVKNIIEYLQFINGR